MSYHDIKASDLKIRIYIPEDTYDTLVYIPVSEPEELDQIICSFEKPAFSKAAVECKNWNELLTPWKAHAVFKDQPDFGGNAKEYLNLFSDSIIPAVEAITGTPDFRGIAGYSLAGLFSLYAFYSTDLFNLCGCVSGSVWFEGFEEWVLSRDPLPKSGSVFFSLGNKEEKTRNTSMQHTGQIMKNITDHLNESDCYEASFRYTKGNHFEGYIQRMNECLSWLLGI